MPRSCAASSASAIWRAIANASSSGIGPRAIRADEILSLDELHHERERAVDRLDAVDAGDARMIERGKELSLTLESR